MTSSEADVLLAQWAAWQTNELRRLDYGSCKWQQDYRPSFDPDALPDGREIAPGDDETMLRVDAALSRLGRADAELAHVLRARYRYGNHFAYRQLENALRAFCDAYERTEELARPRLIA